MHESTLQHSGADIINETCMSQRSNTATYRVILGGLLDEAVKPDSCIWELALGSTAQSRLGTVSISITMIGLVIAITLAVSRSLKMAVSLAQPNVRTDIINETCMSQRSNIAT